MQWRPRLGLAKETSGRRRSGKGGWRNRQPPFHQKRRLTNPLRDLKQPREGTENRPAQEVRLDNENLQGRAPTLLHRDEGIRSAACISFTAMFAVTTDKRVIGSCGLTGGYFCRRFAPYRFGSFCFLGVENYSTSWIVEGSSFLISLQMKSSISMSER
jgi:hypothetical protein